MDAIAEWWRIARQYDEVVIALTAEDIRNAKAEDRAAIVISSQGGDFLGQSIQRLEAFQRLGLRMMIPAYNARSPLGDGCWETADAGLSRLGERWVSECNRLGVLIDLTHTGARTSLDILERSSQPVIFSHSNPKALVDSPRNITDEQIQRCTEAGGVVCLTNWAPLNFLAGMRERPTLSHFLDAIDYVVDRSGIDHVGIGTDMSVGTYPDGDLVRGRSRASGQDYASLVESSPRSKLRYVEDFDDYGKLHNVVEGLSQRGYASSDTEKLLRRQSPSAVCRGVGWITLRRCRQAMRSSNSTRRPGDPLEPADLHHERGGRRRGANLVFPRSWERARDFGVVLLDRKGRSLAQSQLSTPAFTITLPRTCKLLLEEFPPGDAGAGDALITNDPWMGTGTSRILRFGTPVFHKGAAGGIHGLRRPHLGHRRPFGLSG